MRIYSLSINITIGFEDIIEATIESGELDILGYNIEFPINNNNIAIVNIYNENQEKLENNLNIIKQNIDDMAEYDYEIKELNSDEYLTSYMAFLKPFKVGEITIIPNLKDDNNNEDGLYIAKQYAFGTGTHETTFLALEMINEYSKNNNISSKTIADIGCGSGILSLFCYKLGARNITSIDIDNDAVNCTLDNAKYNNIKLNNVFLGSADSLSNFQYDLVIANIETDILIEILPDLKKILKENGHLILSGILAEKEHFMNEAIKQNNLTILNRKQKNDWISLLLR
ncbi:ribosomal protein L11 methyltransferase [Brachyspira pilosicoli P43/6/78]|uniref:Ribosomal protein L11 methyltransferase n=1 Tax=Brachyspira pilosicoli P43/6/78 TaxID=1042417 RepID=A0A3B6VQ62_BRAPL|nr:50S ribosomal protein L11 methyltransferase [Brachyspira pilosicoli]AGA65845.1 ribosomal protein L11 methyltransferase [Brachyspira pilosicoli P43/6/78]MBW5392612.1 methyltransferase domain-containing protein [Brachyspira pilosicoli]